ncbi:3'-5' exonuclease [Alphaproteobacteria bacterium]|nr:3'-5' exonuclease [Alphaproteobacteria bacterium]
MINSEWILIDTETTGFKAPVFVVEIAAQHMKGWEPVGPAFRKLLNQNEDIPSEAARVHGYTREILERDGESGTDAYAAFADYTRGLPVVAYNLRYDWDDVLIPEWERLGVKPIGTRGFCALRLAQRLLDPVPAGNCKLQTLRQFYRLPERGAHTAMGDVETVIDLLKTVLKPLADEQNLATWADVLAYTEEEYFPSRIAFGKFKGRAFQDAVHDTELKDWLSWLSGSANERSSRMGTWYLERLKMNPKAIRSKLGASSSDNSSPENVIDTERTSVKVYQDPEAESLGLLIESARLRLADLETTYTKERRVVDNVRATIFNLTREFYLTRDRLKLKIHYRRLFLDTLLRAGEGEAEEVADQYNKAAADNDEDYKNAAAAAEKSHNLSNEQEVKLKKIFIKLVKLFHPDRHASDPDRRKIYEDLMAIANAARDNGDIDLLEEISADPDAFIKKQGWESLDLKESRDVADLQSLYATLQIRIIELLELIDALHTSPDYELYMLSRDNPDLLKEIAEEQKSALIREIAELEKEAEKLEEEIDNLTNEEAAKI